LNPPPVPPLTPAPETPADGRIVRALRQREATRQRILAAASDVFAARGYLDANIADIIASAKVSRATFYSHFESKEAALAAVLEHFVASLAAALRPVLARTPDGAREELLANLARALALVDGAPALSRLIFSYTAALPPEVGVHLDRFHEAASALILRALNAGARLGLVRPGDQALRARLILGAFIEAARPRSDHAQPARDDTARRQLAETMLDFALGGVLTDLRLATPFITASR
jgi:AcrR family transcriptional regulator